MNKSILGLGNAIVDIFVNINEDFLIQNNLNKGTMKLFNENDFFELKKKIYLLGHQSF